MRVSMCSYLAQQFVISAGASAELEPFRVGLKRSVRSIDPSHCGDGLSNFMAGLLPDPSVMDGSARRRRGGGDTWLLSLYYHPDIPDGCRPRRLSAQRPMLQDTVEEKPPQLSPIITTSTFAHRLYFIWALISLGAVWALACSEASFIQTDLCPVFLFLEEVNVITKGTKKGEV